VTAPHRRWPQATALLARIARNEYRDKIIRDLATTSKTRTAQTRYLRVRTADADGVGNLWIAIPAPAQADSTDGREIGWGGACS
jgi:hypothetical protein